MPTPTPTPTPGSGGPSTAILSPTGGSTTAGVTTVTFTVSDSSAAVSCSLDSSAIACDSSGSVHIGPLVHGVHVFTVTATNSHGVAHTSTLNWNVDAMGPSAMITSPTNGQNTGSTGSIVFSVGDSISNHCVLDGVSMACASGFNFSSLVSGSHTFSVYGVDQYGNVGATASVTWTVN